MDRIRLVPHNPNWQLEFKRESMRLTRLMGANLLGIHHIGSTAIPGILAKPIIDILLVVQDLDRLELQGAAIAAEGYLALGEHGIVGRRYFVKRGADGERTHHMHAYRQGSAEIARHIDFRDYLIAHPAEAARYSTLKQALAAQFAENRVAYQNGKDALARELDAASLAWRAQQAARPPS
jgi:GrpB-like predicted nucleotidyltransferase (UPF0157 family)